MSLKDPPSLDSKAVDHMIVKSSVFPGVPGSEVDSDASQGPTRREHGDVDGQEWVPVEIAWQRTVFRLTALLLVLGFLAHLAELFVLCMNPGLAGFVTLTAIGQALPESVLALELRKMNVSHITSKRLTRRRK